MNHKDLFGMLIQFNTNSLKPISGQVNRASSIEKADSGSIIGRVKAKTIKTGICSFPALRLAIEWNRVIDRWQFESRTERSLRCFLAKATR